MLTDVEREHLFPLALGCPPAVRYQAADGVTPRLQRVLDAMAFTPALVKTATWDIVAWNSAAAAVLTDYAQLEPQKRNVLRLLFLNPGVRAAQVDWESVARFVGAVFRAEAARAGASRAIEVLVDELRLSPEFAALWCDNDVETYGGDARHLHYAELGLIALEYSAFAVDGQPDLGMVVYNPATPEDAERVRLLIKAKSKEESAR
jgi:hypothetical protein